MIITLFNKSKAIVSLSIIFSLFVLDQISKYYIFSLIKYDNAYIKVTSFFNLVRVWNNGVSFGMFRNLPYAQIILSLISIVIIFILIYWLIKAVSKLEFIAVSVILSGAFGNLVDRLIHGAVMDFLDFHIGAYHWPAFNIADSCVSIGVFLLFLDLFFMKKKIK